MFDVGICLLIIGFLLVGIGRTLRKYYFNFSADEYVPGQLHQPKPYSWMKKPAKKKQIKK